jgi:TolA-binding protein
MKKIILISFILNSFIIIRAQTSAEIYNEGIKAYESNHFADAHKLFEKFFSGYSLMDELFATAKYYSSDALLNMGQLDAAAAGFEFVVNNFLWSNFRDRALYKLGLIYFDTEQYLKSRSRLQSLLDNYPESEHTGAALYWIGESYTREDRLSDAIQFLEEAVTKRKNNKYADQTMFTLAATYEKTGDFQNAVKYYDQLLSYYTNSSVAPLAQFRIGICYFKLSEYQSAILELNSPVLSELPEEQRSESLYLLANAYYRTGEYDNAEKTYLDIIQNYSNNEDINEIQYGLAWTYFQKGKYNDAFKIFDFLSSYEDSLGIKSFYWKGEAKRYAGQEAEALKIYRQFLEKYPDNELASGVKYQIGGLQYESQKFDVAEKSLRESIKSTDPIVRAKAYTLLGEIELNRKKFSTAKTDFESAVQTPDIGDDIQKRALFGLGVTLFYMKNYDEAISYLKRVEEIDPAFERNKISFYTAESYYYGGKFADAISAYSQVGEDDKILGPLSLYGKAYSYYSMNDYGNAVYSFSDFIKDYPNDKKIIDAKIRLADSYFGNKNYSSASKVYRELYTSGKMPLNSPQDHFQYAQALYKAGSSTEAINEFRRIQERFPNSEFADRSLYLMGWIHFQENNYNEAIAGYRNVFAKYPSTSLGPMLYYSIGDAYFNQSKYDSAIVNYQRVINQFPNSNNIFDAVNGLQYSYVAMGQPEKAVSLIDEFISRKPGASYADQIYFKKGEIYYSLRKYEEAKESYKEFISNYPKSSLVAGAYYWIGKSAQNLNQNEEAIFNFNKVYESYTENEAAASSVIEMGNIYNVMKNYDAALTVLNKAIKKLSKSPRKSEILYLKGMTLVNKNDFQSAYEVFDEVVLYHKQSIFADKSKFEIGLIELAAERYEGAENSFKQLAESRSDDLGAKAQYYYGLTLLEQEKISEAISAFVRVRTVFAGYDEWLARSFLKLGECYTKLEEFDKAKDMYRAVLTKHRGDIFGQEAQDKLRALQ